MKKIPVSLVFAALLVGCASYDLSVYDFVDRPMAVAVRIDPTAEVDSDYFVRIDPDDPVTTIISIGSSVAKAGEVAKAQERLGIAMDSTDVRGIVQGEVEEFVEYSLGSTIVNRRPDAHYYVIVEIESYGIEAGSWGGNVEFSLDGRAQMFDEFENEKIWQKRLHVRQPAYSSFFGLPGPADNVLSAARLAELSVEEIEMGLEAVAREAARTIAEDIEQSSYGR